MHNCLKYIFYSKLHPLTNHHSIFSTDFRHREYLQLNLWHFLSEFCSWFHWNSIYWRWNEVICRIAPTDFLLCQPMCKENNSIIFKFRKNNMKLNTLRSLGNIRVSLSESTRPWLSAVSFDRVSQHPIASLLTWV